MYDILIKNGTVIDGSGADGFVADVAICGGKIAAIGLNLGEAAKVIDAKGLVVTPGFIDSHSHADAAVFDFPAQIEKIEQGITTNIAGQCGNTRYPAIRDGKLIKMSEFLHDAREIPQGSNIAMFAGHSALRRAVMGMENRAPSDAELERMKALLADAMDAGALGVSFGLIYTPSCYARTDELIALAKVAKEKGGMISAHIRNEADELVEAVEEFITIVKTVGIRGVISHHKAAHLKNHGKVNKTMQMIQSAIDEGFDIYCDVYPYTASRTSLAARFIPKEYVNERLPEYVKDPQMREMFKQTAIEKLGKDLSWVLLNNHTAYPQYSGMRLADAAKLHNKDPWETVFDILEEEPKCQACYFMMCEQDVETVMAWERAMICTDSGVVGNTKFYHPRLRGSFPRVLGEYVRQRKVVSLPEMIRKMTALPAEVYHLANKGYIQAQYDADICIFDPETIRDMATYDDPAKRAEGLRFVIVGGQVAAENAVHNGISAGKVLLKDQKGEVQ